MGCGCKGKAKAAKLAQQVQQRKAAQQQQQQSTTTDAADYVKEMQQSRDKS